MSRLAATLALDVRLQRRNGFYVAVGFLLAVFLLVVSWLPDFDWAPLLPPLLLGNLAVATFFFLAGLVLLERGEGTLEAQIVTPLGVGEYLGSKIATLTLLSLVESVVIVLIAHGRAFAVVPFVAGVVAASVLYCLGGFIAAVRYRSINEMLFPASFWVTACSLPIVDYAGLWTNPILYLHPFQAPLVLLAGAFRPLAAWEWGYGLGYSTLAAGALYLWSRRAFQRFVVAPPGARAA